jgi:hypothetical protein
MECIPLVMEPASRFYPSPVLVLDFQSLYPSVMIAYNMCYSTCLGRVQSSGGGGGGGGGPAPPAMSGRLGFRPYRAPAGAVGELAGEGFLSPNGVLFAGKGHRWGVLPAMLRDILETRLMVKRAMKRPEVGDVRGGGREGGSWAGARDPLLCAAQPDAAPLSTGCCDVCGTRLVRYAGHARSAMTQWPPVCSTRGSLR